MCVYVCLCAPCFCAQLAHPVFGNMMIDYRPVDCDSHRPVSSRPPYVSHTIYGDTIGQGWGWNVYLAHRSTLRNGGELKCRPGGQAVIRPPTEGQC